MILGRGVKTLNLKYRLNFKVGSAKSLVSPRNPGGARRKGPPSSVTCASRYHEECHGPNAVTNLFALLGPAKPRPVPGKTKAGGSPTKEPVQEQQEISEATWHPNDPRVSSSFFCDSGS